MLSCFRYIVGGEFFTHLRKVWLLLNGVATLQQLGRRKEHHPLVLLHTSFSHVWMMRKIWWRFLHLFTMFDVELGHRPPTTVTLAGRPLWKWAVPLLRSTDHLHFRVPSCPVLMGTQSPQTCEFSYRLRFDSSWDYFFFEIFDDLCDLSFPLKLAQPCWKTGAGAADQPFFPQVLSWVEHCVPWPQAREHLDQCGRLGNPKRREDFFCWFGRCDSTAQKSQNGRQNRCMEFDSINSRKTEEKTHLKDIRLWFSALLNHHVMEFSIFSCSKPPFGDRFPIAKNCFSCFFFPAAFSSISQAMWSSRTSALPKS